MNILYINHYAGSKTYGMELRPYYFAKELKNKKHNVTMLAADFSHLRKRNPKITEKLEEEKIENINYLWVKTINYEGNGLKRILNMIQFTFRLIINSKKIYDRYKPDVIIASSPHPLVWLSAYKIAGLNEVKFIAEVRDLWPETLVAMGEIKRSSMSAKILYKLEKYIYKKADRLIFTMPGGIDYVENIGVDTSKVRHINNGVDTYEFNKNKEKYTYNDVYLNDKNIFKVVYTGSMGQSNELSYLIKAAKKIKEKNIDNIKFILFGDGYERSKLEQFVKDNNLDNVIFKGKVEKKYIPNILSKSDLNIFTGKHISLYKYGLSLNKMFEYFASGKPTLSNIECRYDILEKYKCGETVKGGSVESIVDGILKFYNMPKEEYNKYCQNALKAAQDFDFKVLTDKLENVILELDSQEEDKYENTID